MNYKFSCPHCKQHIEADTQVQGSTVKCPTCGTPFVTPLFVSAHPTAPPPIQPATAARSDREAQKERVHRNAQRHSSKPPAKNQLRAEDVGKVIAFVIVVGSFAMCEHQCKESSSTFATSNTDSTDRHSSNRNDSSVAYSMSVLEVRSRLKAPSAAKFCGVNSAVINQNGDRATTSGWVDSQNSFGAMIRTHWTCELHRTSNGDYVVDSCNFTE